MFREIVSAILKVKHYKGSEKTMDRMCVCPRLREYNVSGWNTGLYYKENTGRVGVRDQNIINVCLACPIKICHHDRDKRIEANKG